MSPEPNDTDRLVEQVLAGDQTALAELFDRHRERLRRMVQLRLDRRLRRRVDVSDVLQEAYLDAARQLPGYAREQNLPVFLWLRLVTGQKLMQLHRRHLGTAMRNADLEISLVRGAIPQASTEFLAAQLLGRFTSVSEKVIRAEIQVKLQEVLNGMDPTDREVLALRHFEEFNNADTAAVLGISPAAASKRYIRALKRLKEALAGIPGLLPP